MRDFSALKNRWRMICSAMKRASIPSAEMACDTASAVKISQ